VRNLGTRLRTWPLRLDRTPWHVEQELLALADHIADRAAAPHLGGRPRMVSTKASA